MIFQYLAFHIVIIIRALEYVRTSPTQSKKYFILLLFDQKITFAKQAYSVF